MRQINSAVIVYRGWVYFGLSVREQFFPVGKLLNELAALLFQLQEFFSKMVSTYCYETTDIYQSIDKEIEEANEKSIVRNIDENDFEKT